MSNMDIVEDHSHTQEEADTLMIRLVNIILESCTSSYIVVSSPDTDVFVLLLPSALTAHHQQTRYSSGFQDRSEGEVS